jgi:hypothetical protein
MALMSQQFLLEISVWQLYAVIVFVTSHLNLNLKMGVTKYLVGPPHHHPAPPPHNHNPGS